MTTISLKLPLPVAARLNAAARARQKTKSALVREFIESGLDTKSGSNHASFHAQAGDRAARFRGPRDLATNPRHLKDFGR